MSPTEVTVLYFVNLAGLTFISAMTLWAVVWERKKRQRDDALKHRPHHVRAETIEERPARIVRDRIFH